MSSRSYLRRKALLMGLAASAVLVIAACDGGGDESPASTVSPAAAGSTPAAQSGSDAWASDVCGAIASWESSIISISTDFTDGISKDDLAVKVDEVARATGDLVGTLRDIGASETDAGEQAEVAIGQLADSIESGVDSIKAEAESLNDSGAAGVTSGVAQIAADLTGLIESGRATLEQIAGPAAAEPLKTAIANDETCQALRAE